MKIKIIVSHFSLYLTISLQFPPDHRLQDTTWVQSEDIQQSGVCSLALAVSQPWVRGCLWADKNVYNKVSKLVRLHWHLDWIHICWQDVLCEGLGSWIPQTGRDLYSLLDWDPSTRPPAVAWQSAHTDGQSQQPHLLRVLDTRYGWAGGLNKVLTHTASHCLVTFLFSE